MGLENFKGGVEQRDSIDTEEVGIFIPVYVTAVDSVVKDSGEADSLIDSYGESITATLLNNTELETVDVQYGDAKEIDLDQATWD